MTIRSPRAPIVASLAASVAAIAIAGCSPGPLTRPAGGAPMNNPVALSKDASSGSVETARRQLEGTWDLVALEWSPAGDGNRVPVQAAGTLTYDEFGNLRIDAHTTDPAAPVAAREVTMLSFTGRAVIDPVKHELKLMDLTGTANPDEVLSPEQRRRVELEADLLKLSSFDDQGRINAISTWRRHP